MVTAAGDDCFIGTLSPELRINPEDITQRRRNRGVIRSEEMEVKYVTRRLERTNIINSEINSRKYGLTDIMKKACEKKTVYYSSSNSTDKVLSEDEVLNDPLYEMFSENEVSRSRQRNLNFFRDKEKGKTFLQRHAIRNVSYSTAEDSKQGPCPSIKVGFSLFNIHVFYIIKSKIYNHKMYRGKSLH